MTAVDWKKEAQKGRDDPFYFAFNILGYDRLVPEIHGDWFKWLANGVEDGTDIRKLRLEPRECYKTTVCTVSFSLWLLIQDKPIVRGVKGCDLRILIANSVMDRARDMLREIDSHITLNPIFRACYGDLYSDKQWTATQKTIATRQRHNLKEPTFQCTGKGSQLTSAHYDVIIFDDIANQNDRDSALERDRTIMWMKDAMSLVHPDGLVLGLGTRWHREDVYYWIMQELSQDLINAGERPYSFVSEGCYLEDGKTPRFPSILDAAKLNRLKVEKGYAEFNSQYLNTPLPPDAQIFREEEMLYYDRGELPPFEDLKFFMGVDPSMGRTAQSDFSAIIIIAQSKKTGWRYLVEGDLERRPIEALKNAIARWFNTYHIQLAGFENNGFQEEVRKETQRHLAHQGIVAHIRPIPNSGDKTARIQAAESLIKGIHFPEDWRSHCHELMKQLWYFPDKTYYDDGPDALEICLQLMNRDERQIRAIYEINASQARTEGIGSAIYKDMF